MSFSFAVMICCMLLLPKRGTGSLPVPRHATLVHAYEDILVGQGYYGNALLRRRQVGQKGEPMRYPRYGGKILVAHLVEVLPSLFIGHDHEAKHFFTGQSSLVV
jgi:hypothetical protein